MKHRAIKTVMTSLATLFVTSGVFADGIPVNWPIESVPPGSNPAAFATPRNDWMIKFDRNCKRAKAGNVDLLFQGDSITEGWNGNGREVWKQRYEKLNAASFGISSDRTENVIWRIRNGELDGISPKLIVLMIGTNNGQAPAQIAEGVKVIVNEMRTKCPKSKILLLGVFPRGEKATDSIRTRIAELNRLIEPLGTEKDVVFMDIGKAFLAPDGSITRDIMPDFLHPSAVGYKIWADQIQSEIDKNLGPAK